MVDRLMGGCWRLSVGRGRWAGWDELVVMVIGYSSSFVLGSLFFVVWAAFVCIDHRDHRGHREEIEELLECWSAGVLEFGIGGLGNCGIEGLMRKSN